MTSARGLLAAVAVAAFPLVTCAGVVDACTVGPYTRWFNERKQAQARAVGLVGRPATDVERVLGRASAVEHYSPANTTFEYYPVPWLPVSKVQVHCGGGLVESVELYDD